jgi:O-antigen/teichoic acid export membrane protein
VGDQEPPAEALRDETPTERLDRQFEDILQELRVSQAGVQILFAFLLGIAFTQVFAEIADWQRDVYIATLIATVLATVLFIGPVSYHRMVFRQRKRQSLVNASNAMAILGLVFLMLAVIGSVLLVVSVVLGQTWATWTTAGVAAAFLVVWYALPLTHRLRGRD